MSKPLTDLDLITAFDLCMETTLHDQYYQALSMMRVTPSYTLIDFRKILESICLSLATKTQLVFSNDKLSNQIAELHAAQLIDSVLSDIFYRLNDLCNSGRHIRNTDSDNNAATNLEINAKHARDHLVDAMKHLLSIYFKDSSFNNIVLVNNPSQERKQLLYQALEHNKPLDYFKVGQLYQNMAYDMQASIADISTQVIEDSYLKIAAQHYELACRLSADKTQSIGKLAPLVKVAQTCDKKPLMELILLIIQGVVYSDEPELETELLCIAAKNRNDPHAQAILGFDLYNNKKYSQAETLWKKSAKQNGPLAFKGLFWFYYKGEAKTKDHKKALAYLKQGVALDCIQCQAELGYLMCKGELVEADYYEGRRLIKQAMDQGYIDAFSYFAQLELSRVWNESIVELGLVRP